MARINKNNNKQQIKISKQGVQISYLRFLSDSAGGFLFLVALLIMIKSKIAPFDNFNFDNLELISKELKLFLMLLIFFLTTPIGLLINVISWFLFGLFDLNRVNKIAGNDYFIARGTKAVYCFDKLIVFFKIKNIKEHFFETAIEIRNIISFYYPQLDTETDLAKGARRLIRNFSLVSLMIILILTIGIISTPSVWKIHLIAIGFLLFITFCFIRIQSYLRFYSILHTLHSAYLICVKKNELHDINDIKKYLIEESIKNESVKDKDRQTQVYKNCKFVNNFP